MPIANGVVSSIWISDFVRCAETRRRIGRRHQRIRSDRNQLVVRDALTKPGSVGKSVAPGRKRSIMARAGDPIRMIGELPATGATAELECDIFTIGLDSTGVAADGVKRD